VGPRVLEELGEARRLLDELRVAGINYEDVVATLEAERVQKFADSFKQLLEGINTKRDVFVVYSRTGGVVGSTRPARALPEALPGITRCAPDRC
jgi:hypothetical protein